MRRLTLLSALTLLVVAPAVASGRGPSLQCADRHGSRYLFEYRPTTCVHFGPGGDFAGGVNLTHLRWRSWGRPLVRARGIEEGFHLPAEHIRVTVVAYRLRRCGRIRSYTRLRSTSRYGRLLVRLGACRGQRP